MGDAAQVAGFRSGQGAFRFLPTAKSQEPTAGLNVILPDGKVIEYVIDGRNRRIGKRVDGVLVKGWLYKDQLNPVAELDAAGNITARYVYGTRVNIPVYIEKGGATYRVVSDHLGSPRKVVNVATGAVVQELDYDSFGNVATDSAEGWQPFGFAGGLYEVESGLVRFGARDYDSQTGRWTTKDMIGLRGGRNLYVYSMSNPVNLIDITGLAPGDLFCNPEAAVNDLLDYIAMSPPEGANTYDEISAEILINASGETQYTYSEPRVGDTTSSPVNFSDVQYYATFHTHTNAPGTEPYQVSDVDVNLSEESQKPMYIYLPGGSVIIVHPEGWVEVME